MPRRFPLYAKILLLFALNVALLGLALVLLARAQFGLGRDWPLSADANNRVDAVCDLIRAELAGEPQAKWDEILRRLDESYQNRVHFLIFGGARTDGGGRRWSCRRKCGNG